MEEEKEEAGSGRRWSVTYTKHVKQKRKVYQDGFLHLNSSLSNHKVLLYDEYDKLLDSRYLKKEEAIKSGETLAFDNYLVDIADDWGSHKPVSSLNGPIKVEKDTDTSVEYNCQKPQRRSFSFDKKATFVKKGARVTNLSPSQKIIRDFKKSEMNKFGSSPSCMDMTKCITKEWQVLYTTQITQKAKKFHDGILELVLRGSHGRQVMLYDATRRVLDSRFLKKDEIVGSGESITFEGHMVEIGEQEGDVKPVIDLTQGKSCNMVGKSDVTINKANISMDKKLPAEWDVLYTTQVTQKNKKYNSGILKLASSGFNRMQVSLFAEEGTMLGRRFLSLSEDLRTGTTVHLPKYLVEVGESRGIASSKEFDSKVITSSVEDIPLSRRVPTNTSFCDGKAEEKTSPRKFNNLNGSDSNSDKAKFSWKMPTNEPRRATNDILSILRKQVTQGKFITANKTLVEEQFESHPSVHSYIKHHPEVDEPGNEATVLEDMNENSILDRSLNKISTTQTVLHTVSEYGTESEAISSGLRSGDEVFTAPILNTTCNDHIQLMPTSPSVEPHMVLPVTGSEGQIPIESALYTRSNKTEELEDTSKIISEDIATEATSAAINDMTSAELPQIIEDKKESTSRCHERASSGGTEPVNERTSQKPSAIELENLNQDFNSNETDELPSFDLGF